MITLACKRTVKFRKSLLFYMSIHTQQSSNIYSDEQLHNFLHQCTQSKTLEAVYSFHALNTILGPCTRQPIYFTNNIISLYASFGEIDSACKVFDKMPQRNAVSYNAMISIYSRFGYADEAWGVFCEMWSFGFRPTQFTFGGFLSCRDLDLRRGSILHVLVLKNGLFYADPYVGTSLIGMFGRHGCIDEAVQIFDDMPRKSLVTWNSIISLLGCHGCVEESIVLFCELMTLGYGISGSTVVGLLSCFEGGGVVLGQQIHSLVVKVALDYEGYTANALLNMYVKCHDFNSAVRIFDEVLFRDVVTYNTMIGAFAKSEWPGRGLDLLFCLVSEGLLPNEITYVGAINCCSDMQVVTYGQYVHRKVIRYGMENDVSVGTALIDFYGKCGMLDSARRCFDEIYDKSIVSWNCLMVAFTSRNYCTSMVLFQELLRLNYCPNEITFSSALKVCSLLELQQLHCLMIRMGYLTNVYVVSSLIASYTKNGLVSDALLIAKSVEKQLSVVLTNVIAAAYNRNCQYDKSLEMLSLLDEPDIVSWNILVSTCSHNGQHSEAFELLKHMLQNQIYPDNYTLASILSGCTSLRSLAFGCCIHGLLIKTNFTHCDTFVCNILIDMYAKCGCMKDAEKTFNVTRHKNLITWTTVISALAHHGYAQEALKRFNEMETLGIKPDAKSFMAVLSACRHGGLVEEGMKLFARMQRSYESELEMDHYHSVVDLLARNGHLKEAEQIITSMPFPPNAVIWRSFLEGCKRWQSTEIFLTES